MPSPQRHPLDLMLTDLSERLKSLIMIEGNTEVFIIHLFIIFKNRLRKDTQLHYKRTVRVLYQI